MRRGGCASAAAGVLLFFGIAMACNFAGIPDRWRAGVIILGVCTIPTILVAGRAVRRRMALGPIDWRIENRKAIYVRHIRSGEVRSVEAELVCERILVIGFYRQIWIPRTLYRAGLAPHVSRIGERLEIEMPFVIDPNYNGTWLLRVRLRMRGAPDDESIYKLSAA